MERPPRFSNGKKTLRSLVNDRKRSLANQSPFGKRASAPDQELVSQFVQLRILGAEIGLLFGGSAEAESGVVSISSDNDPHLAIGADLGISLKVEVDVETGLYVLHEGGGDDCVLITSSEERLLDHIVGQLSNNFGDLAPRTIDGAIDVLVGQSLEEVEWRLILRTLHHFRGDLSSAAFSLGMSIEALQSKVSAQLIARRRVLSSSEERQ